jgi:hypothetical protein
MSIRDLQKRAGGRSVLAVVAPKNNDDEQALGDQFLAALGLPIRGHWSTRKPKLMGHLHQYGTEFLIVDDAHDLSAAASDVAEAKSRTRGGCNTIIRLGCVWWRQDAETRFP